MAKALALPMMPMAICYQLGRRVLPASSPTTQGEAVGSATGPKECCKLCSYLSPPCLGSVSQSLVQRTHAGTPSPDPFS
jgi:hypothetical protein